MKIVVLLKQTPDTEAKISVAGSSVTAAGTSIINPYDEYAVEQSLLIKAENPDAEVVVVSLGPADAKERILKALAMGADRGLLIDNAGHENLDSLAISKVLSAAIKEEGASLVLCGKQGIDDDNMHVGTMTAQLLGWPSVNVVNSLTLDGESLKAEREVEGGQVEVFDLSLPAVIGANKALNQPRYASLPGIMKAKRKPLDTKKASDFGVSDADLKPMTVATSYAYPPEKPKGKLFKEESVEQMVSKVVALLKDEAKVF